MGGAPIKARMTRGRQPYEEPKDKECPYCGAANMTRQRLLYHTRENCEKCPTSKRYIKPAPEPAKAPITDPEPVPAPKEPEPEQEQKNPSIVVAGTADYPGDEESDDEIEPTFEGDEPEIPVILVFAGAFILMLIAGLVIFRQKIIDAFRRRGRPPVSAPPGGLNYG